MKFGDKLGDEFREEFGDEFGEKFVTNCWGKYSDSPNSVTNLVIAKFSESPILMLILVTNSLTHLVTLMIRGPKVFSCTGR